MTREQREEEAFVRGSGEVLARLRIWANDPANVNNPLAAGIRDVLRVLRYHADRAAEYLAAIAERETLKAADRQYAGRGR